MLHQIKGQAVNPKIDQVTYSTRQGRRCALINLALLRHYQRLAEFIKCEHWSAFELFIVSELLNQWAGREFMVRTLNFRVWKWKLKLSLESEFRGASESALNIEHGRGAQFELREAQRFREAIGRFPMCVHRVFDQVWSGKLANCRWPTAYGSGLQEGKN